MKINKKKTALAILGGAAVAFLGYKVVEAYKNIREEQTIEEHEQAVEEAQRELDRAKEISDELQEKKNYLRSADDEWLEEQEELKANGQPYKEYDENGCLHEFQIVDGQNYETVESAYLTGGITEDEAIELGLDIEDPDEPFLVDGANTYITKEELSEMRFKANSEEALRQFKLYVLADVHTLGVRSLMLELFNISYEDKMDVSALNENAIDEARAIRLEFFGDEANTHLIVDISVAEIIMYYANKMEWNYSWTVNDILRIMIENTDLPNSDVEAWANKLMNNDLINGPHIGLFLLDEAYTHRYMEDPEFGLFWQMQSIDEDKWSILIENIAK